MERGISKGNPLEVLAPAGDRECLEAAVRYGADAVYLGGKSFGMRSAPANFGPQELAEAVSFAHQSGVKVYLCCNTLPTNAEAAALPEFLRAAREAGVDALIAADIGVLAACGRIVPEIPVHASTQAGVVNYLAASALYDLGASRVVLARELSLEDIREIREKTPPALELEAFVHGAMCMSFSGRCLISNYLAGRDANRGGCAQPCRWKYALVEEKRPGQYFPIAEDESGSYLLNAKDLCMAGHVRELAEAGVTAMKLEGRAKSAFYVAAVTNAYRGAADAYARDPKGDPPAWVLEEVEKVSHRAYSTGFYFGRPDQSVSDGGYIRAWEFCAVAGQWQDGRLTVTARNHFSVGDEAEVMLPGEPPRAFTVGAIYDPEQGMVAHANRPMRRYMLPFASPVPPGAMIRRKVKE